MIVITENNFNSEVELSDKLCVIDLYADWCGPCRMLSRVLDELEQENPEVKFCKINVDDERELAMSFKVTSIPTVAFVKANTFIDVSVGYVPKEKLAVIIEEHR